MCAHAILLVRYVSEKSPQTLVVETEQDMQLKIEELKGKDQVIEVGVYPCMYRIKLIKEWRQEMHMPRPVAVAETA